MSTKGEETRERILGRAMKLASSQGLGGLTIGELAQELDLSKSGLFAHFQSKERLQVAVLERARDQFVGVVLSPALKKPRGEPRVRAICKNWLAWALSEELPGGCVFIAAGAEYDDRPGAVRERLVELQTAWFEFIARAARLAIDEGHFKAKLDPRQFAFELQGICLEFHHTQRLLRFPDAEARARSAFERLIERSRSSSQDLR
jgi:AcrR family transcriptional regulator